MNARRSSIRTAAIVLSGLLLYGGPASAQHGGGGHYGGGHSGGRHYGGGGHSGGYYGRGHYRGYYGGHYSPRFSLFGGLYGYYGYPYSWGYPYPYGYPYSYGHPYSYGYRNSYGGGYRDGGYGYGDDQSDPYESGGRWGGELRLDVRPGDAVVYVDGEFRGPGRRVRRLELPPGRHSIEVVRPGFRTFERTVDVERDRPVDLDVELSPAGS